MSINFSAFEIGRRALNAQQYAIDVTGKNISNVNTPGYSRQSVKLAETAPNVISRFSIGTGVSVEGLHTFRDLFIESRIQTETGISGRLNARRDSISPVEAALQGSEGGGLQNAVDSFFGAFRDLEAAPDSLPLRAVAVQKGVNLTVSFQATATRLEDLRTGIDAELRSTFVEANALAEKIAKLNEQVRAGDNVGNETSALRDTRAEAVNRLAELTGAKSHENSDGTLIVTIGEGRTLVEAGNVYKLSVTNTPPYGLASIDIAGNPAIFEAGKILGFQDSIGEINKQIDNLNGLAAQIVARVNSLHQTGTDLDGAPGANFFNPGSSADPVTAKNINLNAAITGSPRLVVASPVAQPAQSGTVAGEIANLLKDTSISVGTQSGSFSSIFGSMVTEVGEQIRSANEGLQTQAAILSQAQAQREAVSGVSLDEEAINLLQYQKAFEAAARFIRIADEMTQTIISLAQ